MWFAINHKALGSKPPKTDDRWAGNTEELRPAKPPRPQLSNKRDRQTRIHARKIVPPNRRIRTSPVRLTCFRWHLNVFFLHLGDNRTFHLTITEPSKSSNPVPENWWASLIGIYWQVDFCIHRGNLSNASVTILGDGRIYLVPGFLSSPTASASSVGSLLPGEGVRHLEMFLEATRHGVGSVFPGVDATISGDIAEQPPSPVAAKSSLLQQQHGESRREKENNRGNGARERGSFKPPLTTDKQHRLKGHKERRKPSNIVRNRVVQHRKSNCRRYIAAKCDFYSYTGFCFSAAGTLRAPWNWHCFLIGWHELKGRGQCIPPHPAHAAANTFQRANIRENVRTYPSSTRMNTFKDDSLSLFYYVTFC